MLAFSLSSQKVYRVNLPPSTAFYNARMNGMSISLGLHDLPTKELGAV